MSIRDRGQMIKHSASFLQNAIIPVMYNKK